MLTFFDYLRQRAFESVMAGAQEALELLERQRLAPQARDTCNSAHGRSPGVARGSGRDEYRTTTRPPTACWKKTTTRCPLPGVADVRTRNSDGDDESARAANRPHPGQFGPCHDNRPDCRHMVDGHALGAPTGKCRDATS